MTPEEAELALRLAETQVDERVAYYCGLDVKAGRVPVCATSDDPLNELVQSFQFVTTDRNDIAQWLLETPTVKRLEGLLAAYDDVSERAKTREDLDEALGLADTIIELVRRWVSCDVRINESSSETSQLQGDLNRIPTPSNKAEVK